MEARVRQESQAARRIKRYLTDEHEIFRRLGLHLLQKFPDRLTDLVAEQLLTKANLDDTGIHHEFFMLLRAATDI